MEDGHGMVENEIASNVGETFRFPINEKWNRDGGGWRLEIGR